MRKLYLIIPILGLLLLVDNVSTLPKTADAATTLSNLGNTPIVDPGITNGHFEGHGFTVPAGEDYILNSVTFTLSSVTGA
jgi:hypothetical protein